MRLSALVAEGFCCFAGREVVELHPKLTVIVGPNNTGKSSLLRIPHLLGHAVLRRNLNVNDPDTNPTWIRANSHAGTTSAMIGIELETVPHELLSSAQIPDVRVVADFTLRAPQLAGRIESTLRFQPASNRCVVTLEGGSTTEDEFRAKYRTRGGPLGHSGLNFLVAFLASKEHATVPPTEDVDAALKKMRKNLKLAAERGNANTAKHKACVVIAGLVESAWGEASADTKEDLMSALMGFLMSRWDDELGERIRQRDSFKELLAKLQSA